MNEKKKRVTFDDIAKYTGFSKTTVSRFFNNADSLTPKNQEIIRKALIDLDYKENKVAQILAKGETEYIGVIIPNLYLHYFSELLNQVLHTYEENGYKFLVFVGNRKEEVERRYIQELLSYQIEGLLVMSHTISSEALAELKIPIVSVEREDAHISSVNCDNYMGAIQAVSLLAHRDCDVIIHINTPTVPSIPAYQRIVGFEDFCREHELKHDIYIRDMGEDYQTMQKVMSEILDELESKYAGMRKGIFFSDDTRANCFLNLLIRRYKTLPEDYRLVGFDNSPISTEAVYSISTVGQQINQIAHEAVSMLIRQIEEYKASEGTLLPEPVHKVITPVLYRRETTEAF